MIYIIYKGGFPNGMAGTQRILCYAKGLIAAGAKVQVIIPCTTEYDEPRNTSLAGMYEGVPFRYLTKTTISNRFQKIFILGDILDNIRYYWPFCCTQIKKSDKVFFYGLARHKMAIRILHLRGIKTAHELCEYPGLGRNNLYFRYEKWSALHIWFHRYDGFVTISENLFNLAERYKKPSARVINVPILVDDKSGSRCEKPLYNVPYIIHTGTMNEQKDGITIILKAFAQFKKTDKTRCKLIFAGPHSNEKCNYIPLMKEFGIYEDILLLGMINDKNRLATLQRFATMCIVYRYDNIQTRNGFSTKMGEVLMSGVPLVTTPVGGHATFLKDKQNAYIVETGNVNQLSEKIAYVINNPEKAKAVGLKGRELALKQFNYLTHGKRLKAFFDSL